jgi:hypothetical protein
MLGLIDLSPTGSGSGGGGGGGGADILSGVKVYNGTLT